MTAAPDKFSKATGRSIDEWMEYLRSHENGDQDLNNLDHKQLAKLSEEGDATAWWAQSIAIEVERIIGRRVVGQKCDGDFAANASKTVPGEWTVIFSTLAEFLSGEPGALPDELEGEPQISETEKWRYWRAQFVDGTKVTVMCSDGSSRGVDKAKLTIQHEKLETAEQRDGLKAHWKGTLSRFADSLK